MGKFADGWQALRERTLKRQIQMGLVPWYETTEMPADLKDWDALSQKKRKGKTNGSIRWFYGAN